MFAELEAACKAAAGPLTAAEEAYDAMVEQGIYDCTIDGWCAFLEDHPHFTIEEEVLGDDFLDDAFFGEYDSD